MVFSSLLWYTGRYSVVYCDYTGQYSIVYTGHYSGLSIDSTIIHHFPLHASSQCSTTPNYYGWFNKNERLWWPETEKGNFRMAFHRSKVNDLLPPFLRPPCRKRGTRTRKERRIRKRKRRRERNTIVRTPRGLHPFPLLSSLIPLANLPINNTPLHKINSLLSYCIYSVL